MSAPGWSFGLPLLTKDLIEQAAHRRTYILRVVYAAVLYGAALWIYADISGGGTQAEVLIDGEVNLVRGYSLVDSRTVLAINPSKKLLWLACFDRASFRYAGT